MSVAAIALIFFMIGYLSYMKIGNENKVNLKIQVNLVIYGLNDSYVPSIYINVKENKDDSTIHSNTAENIRKKAPYKTNTFHEFETVIDNRKYRQNQFKDYHEHNINTADKNVIQKSFSHQRKSSQEFGKNVIDHKKNSTELVLRNNIPRNPFESSTVNNSFVLQDIPSFLFERNTYIFQVLEKSHVIKSGYLENNSFQNDTELILFEFISGQLNNLSSTNEIGKPRKATKKIDNGIYITINPCLNKDCEISTSVVYNYISSIKESEFNIDTIVNTQTTNALKRYNIGQHKIVNAEMVNYIQTSLLEYISNDLSKYMPLISVWWFILLLSMLLLHVINCLFCRKKKYQKLSDTNCKENGINIDMLRNLLEMKTLHYDSITMLEGALKNTNIRLKYLLEKLMLLENCFANATEYASKNFNLNQDNLNIDIYEQIKDLKNKQKLIVAEIPELSVRLDRANCDMEAIKHEIQYLTHSQISIKNDVEYLINNLTQKTNSIQNLDANKWPGFISFGNGQSEEINTPFPSHGRFFGSSVVNRECFSDSPEIPLFQRRTCFKGNDNLDTIMNLKNSQELKFDSYEIRNNSTKNRLYNEMQGESENIENVITFSERIQTLMRQTNEDERIKERNIIVAKLSRPFDLKTLEDNPLFKKQMIQNLNKNN